MQPASSTISVITPIHNLPMRVRLSQRLGDDALFEFCRINRDLRIERTAEGELVIMSPTGAETGKRNFTLNLRFGVWVEKDGTGVGFDSSTGFVLPNGAERSPDVAWVRRERWDALTPEQRRKFAPLCPDFVIELRSPTDALDEVQNKLVEYVSNGARLGWLIDPDARRAHVYRPGQVVVLENPETLSGDDVLRGFTLKLADIW